MSIQFSECHLILKCLITYELIFPYLSWVTSCILNMSCYLHLLHSTWLPFSVWADHNSLSPVSLHATFLPPPLAYAGTHLVSSLVKGSLVYPWFQKNKHTQMEKLNSPLKKKKKVPDKMNNDSPKGIKRIFEEIMAQNFLNLI